MVLDDFIVGAVVTGDIDAVKAWLAADQSRDVNDFATFGSDMKFTLLAPTKKCSRRRLNSKKMRGGVTRTRSGRTRKRILCKLGDNGIVWKILEFWQATR